MFRALAWGVLLGLLVLPWPAFAQEGSGPRVTSLTLFPGISRDRGQTAFLYRGTGLPEGVTLEARFGNSSLSAGLLARSDLGEWAGLVIGPPPGSYFVELASTPGYGVARPASSIMVQAGEYPLPSFSAEDSAPHVERLFFPSGGLVTLGVVAVGSVVRSRTGQPFFRGRFLIVTSSPPFSYQQDGKTYRVVCGEARVTRVAEQYWRFDSVAGVLVPTSYRPSKPYVLTGWYGLECAVLGVPTDGGPPTVLTRLSYPFSQVRLVTSPLAVPIFGSPEGDQS